MDHYRDRVVWITGASSGIGAALAFEMAANGARLALSGRNRRKLDSVREQCHSRNAEAEIFPFDIQQVSHIPEMAERVFRYFGHVDVLVNNAGISQRSGVSETPLSVDRKIMEINYFGNIALAKAVLPHMVRRGYGHIAITTSITGHFGFPLRSAYSASKHALYGFYESLRTEMAGRNIHITFITPGRIRTSISRHALNEEGKEQGVMDPGQEKGMPAGQSARIIIKGLKRHKREILVGRKEILMVFIHRFFPGIFYRIVRKISHV